MTTSQDPTDYIHRAAVHAEGNRIGKVSQVYLDESMTSRTSPCW